MRRRSPILRGVLAVALVGLACEQLYRHGRDYVLPLRFATVEPGRIYRGGWQKPWPMRRIVRDYKIKTVVALAHPPENPLVPRERALAAELGCKWLHIPIVDTRIPGDPTITDQLAAAAAAIADPANQPVYFHCHHGINRASMAQMAYRMLYCGWTLEQAQDEVARNFGLVPVNHGPDYRHMAQFYNDYVLPLRRQQAQANAGCGIREAGLR